MVRKGESMETREYYEINLPAYLQHDLDAMKEGKWPYDCLWGELYGSINCAFVDGDIWSEKEKAWKQGNITRSIYRHICSMTWMP